MEGFVCLCTSIKTSEASPLRQVRHLKVFFPSLARHSRKTCVYIDHVVRHVPQ